MKKTFWLITYCFIAQLAMGQATPKWAEKAKKAVFSIVTYDKENKIKGTGNGFYIDAQGTALSDYTLFEGAERAVSSMPMASRQMFRALVVQTPFMIL